MRCRHKIAECMLQSCFSFSAGSMPALIFRVLELAAELFDQRFGIIDRLEPDDHVATGQILEFAGELIDYFVILLAAPTAYQ